MDRKRLLRNPLIWILAAVLVFFAFSVLFDDTRGYTQVDTSVAIAQIQNGNVKNALIEDREQRLRLTLTNEVEGSTQIITQYPADTSGTIVNALENAGNKPTFNTVVHQDSFLTQMLIFIVPLGIVLLILFWMMNNAQGGGNRVMSFGKSKAKQLSKDHPKTTFADVAGADEAVEELYEIKDFLQNPGRYQALGAKIPKGVLLYGPPGTGKTLLARAVAGEAGVPFYTISGSDFVEMFVGVGASRVRDLFEQAKQNSPCIIFVDEIDAVGRQRGAGLGGGHDEREQTLNQLLVEMDGFDARGGIILIAATNRPDILDPALLRPGRFDRQIPVDAPDLAGRRAVLVVHAKGKPFAPDVSFEGLAKRTVGMSGADLANVINEAALLTARENGTLITEAALEESVDRVVGGPRRKGKIISEQEKKITAYHEGGHALAAWAMPDLEPVYKLTILPRGRTGGHALVVPEDDKGLMTRSEMIGRLVFAMGGRSAEELVFHEPTTGRVLRHRPGHQDRPRDGHRVRHERAARRRALRARAGRSVPRPLHGQPARLLAGGRPRDRRGGAQAHRSRAHRGVGDPQHLPRRPRRPRARAPGEGDARPQGPRAHLRPRREAAAHHGVQRLRRPHAFGQATHQHTGRAGQGARRAVAACHRARADARRLLPGRQRRTADDPRRLPVRPAAVVGADVPHPEGGGAEERWQAQLRPAQLRRAPRMAPGHHARGADVAAAGAPAAVGCARAFRGHQREHAEGNPRRRGRLPLSVNGIQPVGVDKARAEAAIRELLIAVGEDPEREGLRETPARVARAYAEIFAGLYTDPDSVLDKTFDENHQELILVKDIPIFSSCEHHLVPFHGVAHVGYIPGEHGRVTGLSKLARVVDLYARRPQVQERLTGQVADALVRKLDPRGVIVVMEAEHLCMGMRGIRKPGARTTTSAVRGIFQTSPSSRAEALSLIRGP